jgi:hypothetical protein
MLSITSMRCVGQCPLGPEQRFTQASSRDDEGSRASDSVVLLGKTVDGFNVANSQHIKLVFSNVEARVDPTQTFSRDPRREIAHRHHASVRNRSPFSSPSARRIEAQDARYPAPYQVSVNDDRCHKPLPVTHSGKKADGRTSSTFTSASDQMDRFSTRFKRWANVDGSLSGTPSSTSAWSKSNQAASSTPPLS